MKRFVFYVSMFFSVVALNVIGEELTSSSTQAPDFNFIALSGEQLSLSQLLETKPVMLYFWATWCPYCKKETPNLVNFYEKFAHKITVVGINVGVNDSLAKIDGYVQEFQINFPIIFDDKNIISPSYGVQGTPVFVVISQTQQILYRGHRFPVGIEQALED